MKSKEQAIIVTILVIAFLVIGIIIGRYGKVNEEEIVPKEIILPECYIAKEENCIGGYELQGRLNELVHCCKPPHYVLQGIYWDVVSYVLFDSSYAQRLYDAYNYTFTIDQMKYCTDINDCYERPDLEGCSETADGCNTCCFNTCTLLACLTDKQVKDLGLT